MHGQGASCLLLEKLTVLTIGYLSCVRTRAGFSTLAHICHLDFVFILLLFRMAEHGNLDQTGG
jgi:hypothetical protein